MWDLKMLQGPGILVPPTPSQVLKHLRTWKVVYVEVGGGEQKLSHYVVGPMKMGPPSLFKPVFRL